MRIKTAERIIMGAGFLAVLFQLVCYGLVGYLAYLSIVWFLAQ